jgi:hypothetical protein
MRELGALSGGLGETRSATQTNGLKRENAPKRNTTAKPCARTAYAKAPTTLIVRASINHTRRFGSQRDLAAPRAGLEPATYRLTAGCSTIELPRNSIASSSSAIGIALSAPTAHH